MLYKEKLQSQEWRDFSRAAKENANYACQMYKRGKVRLNLHHLFYDLNKEPWEYEPQDVVVICEGCHNEIHDQLQNFRRFVFGKLNPQSFRVLNGALAVGLDHYDSLKFTYAVAELAASPGAVERFFKAFMDKPSTRWC